MASHKEMLSTCSQMKAFSVVVEEGGGEVLYSKIRCCRTPGRLRVSLTPARVGPCVGEKASGAEHPPSPPTCHIDSQIGLGLWGWGSISLNGALNPTLPPSAAASDWKRGIQDHCLGAGTNPKTELGSAARQLRLVIHQLAVAMLLLLWQL